MKSFLNTIIKIPATVFDSITCCVASTSSVVQKSSIVSTSTLQTKFKQLLFIALVCFIFSSCIKDVTPSDALTTETLTSTPEGLTNAVNGAYALFKDHVPF